MIEDELYVSQFKCQDCKGYVVFSGEGMWWCVTDLQVTQVYQTVHSNRYGEQFATYNHAPDGALVEPDIVWRWAVRRSRKERADPGIPALSGQLSSRPTTR